MTNRNNKLAAIHIAKKQLGLNDDTYRALLFSAAKVESAADIKTDSAYSSVMKAFENAGYKRQQKKKATDSQLAKCYALWCNLHRLGAVRNKSWGAMISWISGRTGGTHEKFLSRAQKALMIEELKEWKYRVLGGDR